MVQTIKIADLARGERLPLVVDAYGRGFTYLRVSVTDLCNLRCVYCMPETGMQWMPRSEILSFEEITSVVQAAVSCGVRKVRLTGGEPLARKNLAVLIRKLSDIRGLDDLSLTTNGTLLAEQVHELAESGLKRVNISLDTLNPSKFLRISRRAELGSIFEGIAAAERAGLSPIKINMVVLGGLNDDEIEEFAQMTIDRNLQVRFIELMPLGEARDCTTGGGGFRFVPNEIVEHRIEGRFGRLIPFVEPGKSDAARVMRIQGAAGTLGFISAMSAAFCEHCNRLRLSADGMLRACLLDGGEVHVRPLLRSGLSESILVPRLLQAFQRSADMKPDQHAIWKLIRPDRMSRIGG